MTKPKSIVRGISEVKEVFKERRGWFIIFPITWWEKVSTQYFGNDIFIDTKNEIRNVYINGKLITTPLTK